MKLLIDECLHQSLAGTAQAAGFIATHVNYLGLSGRQDWALAQRISADEFTFVTNNRADFIRLFSSMELHAGLIVLIPKVLPALQRALFRTALEYIAERELVNTVIEVSLSGNWVRCSEFQLPEE